MRSGDSAAREVALSVNGAAYRVRLDPATPLIYVLRNDLGLVGTRFGCGTEQCGSCKVLIDGRAAFSCTAPVGSAEGHEITTVERSDDPRLAALRAAFIAEQAAQCGYCLSGILIAALALLRESSRPDEAQVRAALDAHLCRCGSHNRIVRAVLRAAQAHD